jgi:enoyl-CoA hydratase/carnithine racemase
MELVLLDKQDRIGTLTLNRPEKLNAMSPELLDEFSEAIETVSTDDDIKVLIAWLGRARFVLVQMSFLWLRMLGWVFRRCLPGQAL